MTYQGTIRRDCANGSSFLRISTCMLRNKIKEMVPATAGEITQLAAILPTSLQLTASMEIPTAAKPTTAPTNECVVDTGQPLNEASKSHVPEASKEPSIPNTNKSA